ncbi:MAG TPA: YlbF family regulator [Gelria sp.]|nr:YlbF family regulator [Gelria sp.]
MADAISPYDKAHELARAITNSTVYKRYVEAKAAVEQNPEYQKKILKIRNQQMELNRVQMLGEEVDSDAVLELSQMFARANQNQVIAEFFNAEGSFIQMFNDLMGIIQDTVEAGFE